MKYIRKFSTIAEYKQYYNDIDNYASPNLCLCTDTSSELHINPTEKRIIVRFATYKDDLEVKLYGVNATIGDYVSRIEIDEDDIYTDKNGNKHEDLYNGNFSSLTQNYIFEHEGLYIVRYTIKNPEIICDFMFDECVNMEAIKIPYGIKTIGRNAFYRCFSEFVHFPAILEIPDSVISIGEYAFSDLLGLLHLILGSGILNISPGAFINTRHITNYDITIKAKIAPYPIGYINSFSSGGYGWMGSTLYIPKGATGYEYWPLDGVDKNWTVVEI